MIVREMNCLFTNTERSSGIGNEIIIKLFVFITNFFRILRIAKERTRSVTTSEKSAHDDSLSRVTLSLILSLQHMRAEIALHRAAERSNHSNRR